MKISLIGKLKSKTQNVSLSQNLKENNFFQRIRLSLSTAKKKFAEKMHPSQDTLILREQKRRAKLVKYWEKEARRQEQPFDYEGAKEFIKSGKLFLNGQSDWEMAYWKHC